MSHLHFGRAVPVYFRRLPELCGTTLSGEQFRIPTDFRGSFNLVLLGFTLRHHELMKTWDDVAIRLQQERADGGNPPDALQSYSLVVRARMYRIFERWTRERWRLRLGDDVSPMQVRNFVVVHTSEREFLEALSLPDSQRSYALLTDKLGAIKWCETEALTHKKEEKLRTFLYKNGFFESSRKYAVDRVKQPVLK